MLKSELDEIVARCEAATPGEWFEVDGFVFTRSVPVDEYSFTQGKVVASLRATAGASDSVFIAHARQDVPNLVAEVKRLTSEKEIVRKWAVRWKAEADRDEWKRRAQALERTAVCARTGRWEWEQ